MTLAVLWTKLSRSWSGSTSCSGRGAASASATAANRSRWPGLKETGGERFRSPPVSCLLLARRWQGVRVLVHLVVVAPGVGGLVGDTLELLVGVTRHADPGGVLPHYVAVADLRLLAGDVYRAAVGKGDDAGDEPLLPHLVDLLLEVGVVLVLEVGEAALLLQVLPYGLALALAFGDLLGYAGKLAEAILYLVERVDAGLDGQLAQRVGVLGVVVPALRAGVEHVHVGRPTCAQGRPHLVHHVHGDGRSARGDVLGVGVARGEHAGNVLLPPALHDAVLLARWAEGRHCPPRRLAGGLDIGVCVALVVVEEDQEVVLDVGERRADGSQAHVGAAAVAAEGDDVDRLVLQLAFAHEGLEPGGGADRGRTSRAELGVHPGDHPGRGHIGRVGHVHAPRGAENDGTRTGRLRHQPHGQGGQTTLACAMAGLVVFLRRRLLYRFDRIELERPSWSLHNHLCLRSPSCALLSVFLLLTLFCSFLLLLYSRTPIQLTSGTSSPSAALLVMNDISSIISGVSSRPPRPPMKLTMRGRCSAL